MIRLGLATPNQIRYACHNYHYAHVVPPIHVAFSCYEDGQFVGIIAYNAGTAGVFQRQFGTISGQVLELVRVALNGEQKSPTTKFIAISLKLLRKQKPNAKMVVSYADITNQGHAGIIYKAGNWIYDGMIKTGKGAYYMVGGELVHGRAMRKRFGNDRSKWAPHEDVGEMEKHRFIYPLDKDWYNKNIENTRR
jgi:ribosomal protein L21E